MDGYATMVRFNETELGIPLSETMQTIYTTKPLDPEVGDRACDPSTTSMTTSQPEVETAASPMSPETTSEIVSDNVPTLDNSKLAPISHPPNDPNINDSPMEDVDSKDSSLLNVKKRRIQPFLVKPL